MIALTCPTKVLTSSLAYNGLGGSQNPVPLPQIGKGTFFFKTVALEEKGPIRTFTEPTKRRCNEPSYLVATLRGFNHS